MKFNNNPTTSWKDKKYSSFQGVSFSLHQRFKCILLLFLFLSPNLIFGQTHELKELIKSKRSIPKFQERIDSFLLVHKDECPRDSLADCYHEIGYQWYYKEWRSTGIEDNLEKAISHTSKAIDIKKKQSPIDSLSLQKSLSNIGTYQRRGEFILDAIATYSDLVELDIRNRKTYNAYLYLSSNHSELGDHYRAIEVLKEGIKVISIDTSALDLLAAAYYNLADRYSNVDYVKNSDKILENLKLSSLAAAKSKLPINKQNDLLNKSNHLNGNRLLRNLRYHEAVDHFKMAIKKLDPSDNFNLAVAYNSLGLAHLKIGELKLAFNYFQKSISFDQNYSAPLENLGDYYIQTKEFKKSLSTYQEAILMNINTNEKIDYQDLPSLDQLKLVRNKEYVLSHLIQKANAWKSFYHSSKNESYLVNGLNTFQLADQLVDEIRFQSFEEQSKLYWQNKGNSLYLKAVEICHILGKPKMAYYFMEKNKALLLLGDATSKNARKNTYIPQNLIGKEFEYKRKIYLFQNSFSLSNNSSDSIRQNILKSKKELRIFKDSIFSVYPEYKRMVRNVSILPYDKFVREYIKEDEVVVHFITSNTSGFGLLHTKTKSILYEIEDFLSFSKKLKDHLFLLRSPITDNNKLEVFINRAHEIFQLLFPNEAIPLLKNKTLTIIPDNDIQQLPFETLISSLSPSTYLLNDCDINYQYSISYLTMNSAIQRDAENNFIGIAPETFSSLSLPTLSHSKNEIVEINKSVGGKMLTTELANKESFLSNANDYKIIHLSTHASSGRNNIPWIAFHDEKLFMDELYSIRNQSDLVVLSACNTSIGEYKKGEGAMSLARGFFYAGANSVLATLWSTNDRSSKEIMVEFYQQLKLGNSKSKALREAKMKYINSSVGSATAPYFWASPVVIGNNENISIDNGWPINTTIVISILIILLIIYIIKRNKKRSIF